MNSHLLLCFIIFVLFIPPTMEFYDVLDAKKLACSWLAAVVYWKTWTSSFLMCLVFRRI